MHRCERCSRGRDWGTAGGIAHVSVPGGRGGWLVRGMEVGDLVWVVVLRWVLVGGLLVPLPYPYPRCAVMAAGVCVADSGAMVKVRWWRLGLWSAWPLPHLAAAMTVPATALPPRARDVAVLVYHHLRLSPCPSIWEQVNASLSCDEAGFEQPVTSVALVQRGQGVTPGT